MKWTGWKKRRVFSLFSASVDCSSLSSVILEQETAAHYLTNLFLIGKELDSAIQHKATEVVSVQQQLRAAVLATYGLPSRLRTHRRW